MLGPLFVGKRVVVPDKTTPRRILVVDGDDGFLAFAAEALHSFHPGYEVATARDFGQASEWLDSFAPDLVVVGSAADGAPSTPFATKLAQRFPVRLVRIDMGPEEPPDIALERLVAQRTISRPVTLPDLLRTVRDVMRR